MNVHSYCAPGESSCQGYGSGSCYEFRDMAFALGAAAVNSSSRRGGSLSLVSVPLIRGHLAAHCPGKLAPAWGSIAENCLESDEGSCSYSRLLRSTDHSNGCTSSQQTHWMKKMTGARTEQRLCRPANPMSHTSVCVRRTGKPIKWTFYLATVWPPRAASPIPLLHGAVT